MLNFSVAFIDFGIQDSFASYFSICFARNINIKVKQKPYQNDNEASQNEKLFFMPQTLQNKIKIYLSSN